MFDLPPETHRFITFRVLPAAFVLLAWLLAYQFIAERRYRESFGLFCYVALLSIRMLVWMFHRGAWVATAEMWFLLPQLLAVHESIVITGILVPDQRRAESTRFYYLIGCMLCGILIVLQPAPDSAMRPLRYYVHTMTQAFLFGAVASSVAHKWLVERIPERQVFAHQAFLAVYLLGCLISDGITARDWRWWAATNTAMALQICSLIGWNWTIRKI